MAILNWLNERQVVINGIRFVVGYSHETAASRYTVDLLNIPALAAGIEIKSNDLSQIPLNVYFNHAAGRVLQPGKLNWQLSKQPNRYQNASQFWKQVGMQMTLGECFISMRGEEFVILPWGSCIRYVTLEGELRYAATYSKGELDQAGLSRPGFTIKDDYAYHEVLHLYNFMDEFGFPIPLRVRFKKVLGLGSDLYAYMTNVYNRGGLLMGYLATDQKVADDGKRGVIRAFKDLFKKAFSSVVEAGEAGSDITMSALDQGWKYQRLDMTPQEAMLLQTKEDLIRDFSQMVQIPLWKLGIVKDYHYSTAEVAQREYMSQSLNPMLKQIEDEINVKCFMGEIDRRFVEFNREAIIYLDGKTAAEVDDLAVKNGTKTVNEVRDRLHAPRLPGGDARQIAVNTQSSDFTAASEVYKLQQMKNEALTAAKNTVDYAQLRMSVAGASALASLQVQYTTKQIARTAAMAHAMLMFGFTMDEAGQLFPELPSAPPPVEPAALPVPGGTTPLALPPGEPEEAQKQPKAAMEEAPATEEASAEEEAPPAASPEVPEAPPPELPPEEPDLTQPSASAPSQQPEVLALNTPAQPDPGTVPSEEHTYASTQINLDGPAKDAVLALASAVPEEALAEEGRETVPHITVLYGLQTAGPEEAQQALGSILGPISGRLGKVAIFQTNEAYDVIVVEAFSEHLVAAHDQLAVLPHIDTYPKYIPHATVAYVKKGAGASFVGRTEADGLGFSTDTIVYSGADGTKAAIKLASDPKAVSVSPTPTGSGRESAAAPVPPTTLEDAQQSAMAAQAATMENGVGTIMAGPGSAAPVALPGGLGPTLNSPPLPALPEVSRSLMSGPSVYLAHFKGMQERYGGKLSEEQLRNVHCLRTMIFGVVGDISKLYDLPEGEVVQMRSWAARYFDTANKRVHESTPSVDYEVNRVINATNYEAMRRAYGSSVPVVCVRSDGEASEVRSLGMAGVGGLRHPPVRSDDCTSFLVLTEDKTKAV